MRAFASKVMNGSTKISLVYINLIFQDVPLLSAGPPGNDGTNACSFLAMKIADAVVNASIADAFSPLLPEIAEVVIWQLPFSINSQRDVTHLYDAQEAYQFLNRLGLLQSEYDLHCRKAGVSSGYHEVVCKWRFSITVNV